MSSAGRLVKRLADPLGIFKSPKSPGAPPQQEDPQVALEREATNSAIAGDIAARNALQQSSTLGSGSRFLQQSTDVGANRSATSALRKPKKVKKF